MTMPMGMDLAPLSTPVRRIKPHLPRFSIKSACVDCWMDSEPDVEFRSVEAEDQRQGYFGARRASQATSI